MFRSFSLSSVKRPALAVFLAMLLGASLLYASAEEGFFSYERIFLNQDVLSRMSKDGRIRTQIKDFGEHYTEGLYDLSSGDADSAVDSFKRARAAWPEFYVTDLALGMAHEARGDVDLAARFYKSYLRKLYDLRRGYYRISAPVIRTLTGDRVESYEYAYEQVEQRLARYGIDIEDVRPVRDFPVFLRWILFLVSAVALALIVKKAVIPRYRRTRQLKNPPEGFWVCPRCFAGNPELRTECERCGYRKEE